MSTDEIVTRTISQDEALPFRRAVRAGFAQPETSDEDPSWARDATAPYDRARAAFDGDTMVATLRSFPNELTVPGGAQVPVGAVTAVTCQATHRRRGLLTRMMRDDLTESKERGEVADVLIASEYPIYGRFGYGPAVETTSWELDTAKARMEYGGEGSIEFVSNEQFRAEAPAIFDRVRRGRPGMIDRDDLDWDFLADLRRPPEEKPWHGFRVLCRDADGVAQGWASYTVKDDWQNLVSHSSAEVSGLLASTSAVQARLVRFLSELDLITRVVFRDRPADELLPHLLANARAARQTHRGDFLWVRLLDVPRALMARTYEATGRVVLEVVDDEGLAGGRYALDASPGGVSCRSTSETADLTLPVRTLAAAYLGGYRLDTLARAGWADGDVGVLSTLLASSRTPWCNTWF